MTFLKPEIIGPEECPILHRWTFGGDKRAKDWRVKLMLHRFLPRADDRDVHDHPRPFLTIVLRGGYDDLVPCPACHGRLFVPEPGIEWAVAATSGSYYACTNCRGDYGPTGVVAGDRMRPGMIRYRPANYTHRTRVLPAGAWTIVVMGPPRRAWGFWVGGRWMAWREYRSKFGDGMRCD